MLGEGQNMVGFGKFRGWKYFNLAMDPGLCWYNDWALEVIRLNTGRHGERARRRAAYLGWLETTCAYPPMGEPRTPPGPSPSAPFS